MSTQVPMVSQKRLCPTLFMPAAFGLEDAEAAPPLGERDPLGDDEVDEDGVEELPPAF